ncbi:unnamed protein product [Mytilus edulis]|uniref:Uncharacterized protein n=1 Tax=Mytilus edulis TaxID=6550 RepID=A0A8S3TFX0_MYTED|nr:unnamed protein product [Mytilus edulis]
MTTELETNIVAVERVKEYTETPTEVNSSYFIYIPTQGVVSENDNRVRDKHCSCRESEGIHRNSYRGVVSENDSRVRDKHCSCRESEGIHRNSYRSEIILDTYIYPTQRSSHENDNRVDKQAVEYTETPTEVNSSYFIYIPTQGVVSENDNRVRDKHCSCRESEGIHRNSYRAVERVKEYTETPTEVNSSYFIYIPTQGVVSENDNRVRDKHCSCRESEGIHRNSYRGVVSENDNRVRDKHCSCRESEGIHRNSYRGVVSENDNRVRDKHCSCRERMKEYSRSSQKLLAEVNSSYFIYISLLKRVVSWRMTRNRVRESNIVAVESEGIHRNSYRGVVSENDNRVRDKHCSCRKSEGIHRNSYRGK